MAANKSDLGSIIKSVWQAITAYTEYKNARSGLEVYSSRASTLGEYLPFAYSKEEKILVVNKIINNLNNNSKTVLTDRQRRILNSGGLSACYGQHKDITDTILCADYSKVKSIDSPDYADSLCRQAGLILQDAGIFYKTETYALYNIIIRYCEELPPLIEDQEVVSHLVMILAQGLVSIHEGKIIENADIYEFYRIFFEEMQKISSDELLGKFPDYFSRAINHLFDKKIYCNNETEWLCEQLHANSAAKKLINVFLALNKMDFEALRDIFQDKPITDNNLPKGKYVSNKDAFRDFYRMCIEVLDNLCVENVSDADQLLQEFLSLYKNSFLTHDTLFLCDALFRSKFKSDLGEGFRILKKADFSLIECKPLYELLIKCGKEAQQLAKKFSALKDLGFQYVTSKYLYEAVSKEYNIDLVNNFKELKETGFSYSEFPTLYHTVIGYPHHCAKLAAAFNLLREVGILYSEFPFLYNEITSKPDYALELGTSFKALKEASIPYSNFLFLYDAIKSKPHNALRLSTGFKVLKEADFPDDTFRFLCNKFIKNPLYADKCAFVFKSFKEVGIVFDAKVYGPYDLLIDSINNENEVYYDKLLELINLFIKLDITPDKFPTLFKKFLFTHDNKLILLIFKECERLGYSSKEHRFLYYAVTDRIQCADYPGVQEIIKQLSEKENLMQPEELQEIIAKFSASFRYGPLNKTQATRQVEKLLEDIIGNGAFESSCFSFHFNKFDGYYVVNSQNQQKTNLSLLLRNANLSHLTLNYNLIIKIGDFVDTMFSGNFLKESADEKRKDVRLVLMRAFSFYLSVSTYKNINKFFRAEALDHDKRNLFLPDHQNESKEFLICFLLGCLITDALNRATGDRGENMPENMSVDREESLTSEEIRARMANSYKLSALTSYSFFNGGSPCILRDKNKLRSEARIMLTTLIGAPYLEELSRFEREIIFPAGTMLQTAQVGENSLVSTIVRSPSLEPKDHFRSESALNYAAKRYLLTPYAESSHQVWVGEENIFRPNHNMTHAYRVMLAIESVIQYFSVYAKDEDFKEFCASITPEDIEWLRIAAAFSVSGRESELSAKDDLEKYNRYKDASKQYFESFVAETFKDAPAAMIQRLAEIIRYVGNPDYPDKISSFCAENEQKQRKFYHAILKIARDLDLPRCYSVHQYTDTMQYCRSLSVNSEEQKYAYDAMLRYHIELIKAHGATLRTDIEPNGKLVTVNIDYQPTYAESSLSMKRLFDITQTVPKPRRSEEGECSKSILQKMKM